MIYISAMSYRARLLSNDVALSPASWLWLKAAIAVGQLNEVNAHKSIRVMPQSIAVS